MAHEKNRNGKYYCSRLGAAYDFRIVRVESGGDSLCNSTYHLVEWILEQGLPFDSLYYYGSDSRSETLRERPIHISYSLKRRHAIWAFTEGGVPTKKGIAQWLERVNPRF